MHERGDGFDLGIGWRWLAEQVTTVRQRASPRAIGKKTEVTNGAARCDVEEKTSEEFVRLERHDLHAVVICAHRLGVHSGWPIPI